MTFLLSIDKSVPLSDGGSENLIPWVLPGEIIPKPAILVLCFSLIYIYIIIIQPKRLELYIGYTQDLELGIKVHADGGLSE
jgi:hypothetical protein